VKREMPARSGRESVSRRVGIFVWLITLGKIRAMTRQKEMLKSFEMSSRRAGRAG